MLSYPLHGSCFQKLGAVYYGAAIGRTGCVTSSHQGGDMISHLRCIFIVALVTRWIGLVLTLVTKVVFGETQACTLKATSTALIVVLQAVTDQTVL